MHRQSISDRFNVVGKIKQLLQVLVAASLCAITSVAVGQTPIKLDSLPQPPESISKLITSGRVSFVQGQQFLSEESNRSLENLPDELRQSLKRQSSYGESTSPRSGRLDAITAYRVEFRYAGQRTWDWDASTRRMTINMRPRLQTWNPVHTIWLRSPPKPVNFWTDPLVLHEFDHVRLSADRSMKQRFAGILRAGAREEFQLSENQFPSDQLADELTNQWVQSKFREIVELIDIRYRELDEDTLHGRRPLPADSNLIPLLRPEDQ